MKLIGFSRVISFNPFPLYFDLPFLLYIGIKMLTSCSFSQYILLFPNFSIFFLIFKIYDTSTLKDFPKSFSNFCHKQFCVFESFIHWIQNILLTWKLTLSIYRLKVHRLNPSNQSIDWVHRLAANLNFDNVNFWVKKFFIFITQSINSIHRLALSSC